MDPQRHRPECSGSLRAVCRAGAGGCRHDGLLQRHLHTVGRHLHDDGHSLLVYDPRCDPHPGRPRKPVGRRPHLCGRRLGAHCNVYHAAGWCFRRRQRAHRLPLGSTARGCHLCGYRGDLLRQRQGDRQRRDKDRHRRRDVQGAVLQRSGACGRRQHRFDQLGAVSDLQLYHLFLQVRFRRHRLEGQLHAVLNHRRCGTDPRHDGPLSGAAQKAQQHCRIYGKPGVGAGRLCCAAPALPDGLFRQSGTALRAGRGGVCLQRHAQRTDDSFPLQQCGLRPAQDRAP